MASYSDVCLQLNDFGLEIPRDLIIGRLQRCRYLNERKKSGWYILHSFNVRDNMYYVGSYGSWKSETQKIKHDGSTLTDEENAILIEKSRQAQIEAEKERQAQHKISAEECKNVYAMGTEAGYSPYLQRKQVQALGDVRFYNDHLLIPIGKEGRLTSLQSITPDGFKKYYPGGELSGCYAGIRGSEKMALCEGYSTGASIHMATGWSVCMAMMASNLVKVAPYLKGMDVVICADNDLDTEKKIGKNPGILAAEKAAQYLGCEILVPNHKGGSDFNDVHCDLGMEELRRQLNV